MKNFKSAAALGGILLASSGAYADDNQQLPEAKAAEAAEKNITHWDLTQPGLPLRSMRTETNVIVIVLTEARNNLRALGYCQTGYRPDATGIGKSGTIDKDRIIPGRILPNPPGYPNNMFLYEFDTPAPVEKRFQHRLTGVMCVSEDNKRKKTKEQREEEAKGENVLTIAIDIPPKGMSISTKPNDIGAPAPTVPAPEKPKLPETTPAMPTINQPNQVEAAPVESKKSIKTRLHAALVGQVAFKFNGLIDSGVGAEVGARIEPKDSKNAADVGVTYMEHFARVRARDSQDPTTIAEAAVTGSEVSAYGAYIRTLLEKGNFKLRLRIGALLGWIHHGSAGNELGTLRPEDGITLGAGADVEATTKVGSVEVGGGLGGVIKMDHRFPADSDASVTSGYAGGTAKIIINY